MPAWVVATSPAFTKDVTCVLSCSGKNDVLDRISNLGAYVNHPIAKQARALLAWIEGR